MGVRERVVKVHDESLCCADGKAIDDKGGNLEESYLYDVLIGQFHAAECVSGQSEEREKKIYGWKINRWYSGI